MTPNEYQRLAARTDLTHAGYVKAMSRISEQIVMLEHATIGIASESGELADALKKHIYYGRELDVENIKEELGDLMWYVALAAGAVGAKLEDLMEQNIDKLAKRYPETFTEELAKLRLDKQQ